MSDCFNSAAESDAGLVQGGPGASRAGRSAEGKKAPVAHCKEGMGHLAANEGYLLPKGEEC